MEYTDEQISVSQDRSPRLLVKALAGTGKTETVALRIVTLIGEGVSPDEILCLCFTNAAVAQLKSRLESKGINSVKVSTIDAHAHSVFQKWCEENDKTIDLTSGEDIAKKLLTEYGLGSKKGDADKLARMSSLRWFGRPMRIEIPGIHAEDVDRVLNDYDQEKRYRGVVDFTDILILSSRIKSKQYKEVILDEAQDATAAHTKFIETLTSDRIVMVGDENQSIFEFAGVDPQLFEKYCRGWKVLDLTTNFRSTPQVLNVVNATHGLDIKPLQPSVEKEGKVYFGTNILRVVDNLMSCDGSKGIVGRTKYDMMPIINVLKAVGVDVGCSWEGHNHQDYEYYAATIHASKGLEWDNVCVFNLTENAFKGYVKGDREETDIIGELRLAYVAASRAKINLFLHSFDGKKPYNIEGGEIICL